jgi:hypothetical protein
LEDFRFCARNRVFRGRRTIFLRHATFYRLEWPNARFRASATLDRYLAILSFTRAVRRASDYPGAGQASGRIIGGTLHFAAGAIAFIAGEVLKLTFVERLFQLNRKSYYRFPPLPQGMDIGGG